MKAARSRVVACLAAPDAELRTVLSGLTAAQWEELVRASVEHQVGPMVYRRIGALSPVRGVPAGVQERLSAQHAAVGLRNVDLYKELRQVLEVLRVHDTPAIVLKGAYLAALVYRDLGLRSMNDVDVLIKPEAVRSVDAALLSLGYVPVGDHDAYTAEHFHYRYLTPLTRKAVEIHWDIRRPGWPRAIDLDGLWSRAEAVTLAGLPVMVFSLADQLLYLCYHMGFQHVFGYFPIRGFTDIKTFLDLHGAALDWESMLGRTRQWRLEHSVYLSLHLARKWFGAAVPDWVLARLAPADFDARFETWVEGRLFGPPTVPQPAPSVGSLAHDFRPVWLTRRPDRKLVALFHSCVPPFEQIAAGYGIDPTARFRLRHYVVHLGHLAGRRRPLLPLIAADPAGTVASIRDEFHRVALTHWLRES